MKVLKKVTPRYTKVLTTADIEIRKAYFAGTNVEDPGKTITGYSSIQKVVALGPSCTGLKVGDHVLIDFSRYARPVQSQSLRNHVKGEEYSVQMSFNIPVIILDGEEYLDLQDNDIVYIVDDFEEVSECKGDA